MLGIVTSTEKDILGDPPPKEFEQRISPRVKRLTPEPAGGPGGGNSGD